MTCFLTDDVVGQTRYIWEDDWTTAEHICKEERLELIGEHVNTVMWWDMPKWMEELSETNG